MLSTGFKLSLALIFCAATANAASNVGVRNVVGTELAVKSSTATPVFAEQVTGSTWSMRLFGDAGVNLQKVNDQGAALVEVFVADPTGTTPFEFDSDATVGVSSVLTTFALTAGTTFTINGFFGGAEVSISGSRTDLTLEDGTGGSDLIAAAFTSGNNFDPRVVFTTVAIAGAFFQIEQENLGGGSVDMFARVQGFSND